MKTWMVFLLLLGVSASANSTVVTWTWDRAISDPGVGYEGWLNGHITWDTTQNTVVDLHFETEDIRAHLAEPYGGAWQESSPGTWHALLYANLTVDRLFGNAVDTTATLDALYEVNDVAADSHPAQGFPDFGAVHLWTSPQPGGESLSLAFDGLPSSSPPVDPPANGAAPVPEPATLALLGLGLAAMGLRRRIK